jgi:hypothetical protein
MGGEQWSVLSFGPREQENNYFWINKLLKSSSECSICDGNGGDCADSDSKKFEKLDYYLQENGMTMIYHSNFDWDSYTIGMIVEDYDTVTTQELNNIRAFCKKHNLSTPTFIAGIIGEFE